MTQTPMTNNQYEKWNRITQILMWVTGAVAVVVVCLIFAPLFWHAQQLHKQNSSIQSEIEQLKISNQKMAEQVSALKSDPRAVEKEARETLGLAKPGETVYRFQNPPTNPAPKKP